MGQEGKGIARAVVETVASVSPVLDLSLLLWDRIYGERQELEVPKDQGDAEKMRLMAEWMQATARVEQERALATRILSATEVEIEEDYAAGGEGSLGLKADAAKQSLGLGASAEGRVVTRRVVRLKGWPDAQPKMEAVLVERSDKPEPSSG
jgi:hypothetical protein